MNTNVFGGGTPLKVLLYLCSGETKFIMPSLRLLTEQTGRGIVVIGVTAVSPVKMSLNGQKVPFLPLDRIQPGEVELVLLCGAGYHTDFISLSRVLDKQEGTRDIPLLPDRLVCFKGFSLTGHLELKASRLSIISLNCFGCLVSHLLTLPFLSPFVNLYTEEEPFLQMLEGDPRTSLRGNLEYRGTKYNSVEKHDYPVFDLNGLPLYFLHYQPDREKALTAWERRLARINWYNLFVTMYTDSKGILERFATLPFAKKACFVPFESDIPCAYPVLGEQYEMLPLNDRVNYIGWGFRNTYNLWDMLLYGKKTAI